jgi:hypothetical protein
MGLTVGTSLSLISLSVFILCFYSIYNAYNTIQAQTDLLINNNQCDDVDDDGNNYFDTPSHPGTYDARLCSFNPLMLSDKDFRDNILSLYGPNKIVTAIKNLTTGAWNYPSTSLIQKDPVLSKMILNSWFTADDALNTHKTVYYSKTLNSFSIDGIEYNNFDNSGLNLSSYTDPKSGKTNYYLYMDNNVMIELPIQLYIQNLPQEQRGNQKVKVNGVFKTLNVPPINITNINDLKSVLSDKFYNFIDNNKNTCKQLNPDGQKNNDNICKFFASDSLSGLVIALKRILVVPMNNPIVVADYINYVDTQISNSSRITYLEFFLWLAMKSHRDSLTYDFILDKNL